MSLTIDVINSLFELAVSAVELESAAATFLSALLEQDIVSSINTTTLRYFIILLIECMLNSRVNVFFQLDAQRIYYIQ